MSDPLEKVRDDLLDLINYAVFLYRRITAGTTHVEVLARAVDVYLSRDGVYGEAWRRMEPDELAAGLRLKAGRIAAFLQENGGGQK